MNFTTSVGLAVAATLLTLAPSSATAASRNGDLDRTFGEGGIQIIDFGSESAAYALAIAPDGKIVLGGSVHGGSTANDFGAARLHANGAIDTSFSFDGRTTVVVAPGAGHELPFNGVVQSDGKIVLVGDAPVSAAPDATTDIAVVRFNVDGTLDTTFSGDGIALIDFGSNGNDRALDVALLPDGKLILVGSTAAAGEGLDFAVVKLNIDGSRDTTFDTDGRQNIRFNLDPDFPDEIASSVAIDANGRILVAGAVGKGSVNSHDFGIARLMPNGQLDLNFDGDGRRTIAFDIGGNLDDQVLEMLVAPDGAIFLTGAATDAGYDAAVVKLFPDGSLDPGFGTGGRVTVPFDLGSSNTDVFYGAALQPDGALVLSGYVQISAPNNADLAFVRLLPNGQLDPSFGLIGKSVVSLDLGGSLLDAAIRSRYSNGALIFAGAVDTGSHINFLAGKVLLDVLFADGYEDDGLGVSPDE